MRRILMMPCILARTCLSLAFVQGCTDLIVPDDAKRSYELFTLENGMNVITISDPETLTSAASMTVALGSMSDPEDLPGLAHFIEHMLFLGTKEYPSGKSNSPKA